MTRNSTSMSQQYKNFKNTNPKITSFEDIEKWFAECVTTADVEDVIYGDRHKEVELIGEFTFTDYDEDTFELECRLVDQDTTQTLTYNWKHPELVTFDLELRGEFTRRVQVKALSQSAAEDILEELLRKASLILDDFENDEVRTVGDIEITDVDIY